MQPVAGSQGHDQKGQPMTENLSRFTETKQAVSLKAYAEEHLEHRGGGLVCPVCKSGTGPHATPAFSITADGEHWNCFRCNRNGDVFDLAGAVLGIESRTEQLNAVREWAGMPVSSRGTAETFKRAVLSRPMDRREEPAPDYDHGRIASREYIESCRLNMMATGENGAPCPGFLYLTGRGFTLEEIAEYGFGWDAENGRVVIPWSAKRGEWYHIDRDVTGAAPHKYTKPRKADVGPQPLHNARALETAGPVFVVEGLMDALAVRACGYEAIAMGGTAYKAVTRAIMERGYEGSVILMADNDGAGTVANREAAEELDGAACTVVTADYSHDGPDGGKWPYKDAGEALESDRTALEAFLDRLAGIAEDMRGKAAEERYKAAMSRMRVLDPVSVAMGIYALDNEEEPIPTGIKGLDGALDGGMRHGVHVLGAVSSLGKTTLAVQMADYIAAHGRPVLFVTIEQSAEEITAKSLTRIMRALGGTSTGNVTTRDLMSGKARAAWSERKQALFLEACEYYTAGTAKSLRILEATAQPSVSDIEAAARAMAEHDGQAPVVFIDYLQLLKSESDRDTDKQATDKNMMALRQMARDMRTPVFVISSLNRSSYSGSISLDSFKESGAIEYGADVLMGLQPEGMTERLEGVSESKSKSEANKIMRETKSATERACEVVILKQRSGTIPAKGIPLTFHPSASMFEDGGGIGAPGRPRIL